MAQEAVAVGIVQHARSPYAGLLAQVRVASVSPASGAADRPEPTSSESTGPSKKQWVHAAAIQAPASWLDSKVASIAPMSW